MPEYIYALHDFLPENDDEVGFCAGERIEVIEKDDQYGDGWWQVRHFPCFIKVHKQINNISQGRNTAGKEGLFPVSYTTSIPPTTNAGTSTTEAKHLNSALQPLPEELETDSPPVLSPIPKPVPVSPFLTINGEQNDADRDEERKDPSYNPRSAASDGEMMRATMTDVQKAIEQLGRGTLNNDDRDGTRSFSFASTKEGGDTETDDTDFDLSDLDGGLYQGDREDWHKNTRRKLAAKARRAVEQAEQLEAIMNEGSSSMRRHVAPPIEAEMSDESDVNEDGNFTRTSGIQRTHPGILEEDENEVYDRDENQIHDRVSSKGTSTTTMQQSNNDLEMPPKDESQIPTATAQSSFHVSVDPRSGTSSSFVEESLQPKSLLQLSPEKFQAQLQSMESSATPVFSSPASQLASTFMNCHAAEEAQKSSSLTWNVSRSTSTPSHTDGDHALNSAPRVAIAKPEVEQLQVASPTNNPKTHPSEWNLEQVVQWLKDKGFEQDVCDKFVGLSALFDYI